MSKIAWLVVFLSLLPAPVRASTIDDIRAKLAHDSQMPADPTRVQKVFVGPLTDGRRFEMRTHVVIKSAEVFSEAGNDGIYYISMGQLVPLNAVFIDDASLVCAHAPQFCPMMEDYIQRVWRAGPVAAPTVEEAFPTFAQAAREARSDDVAYRAAIWEGMKSLGLMITLHEMGHAVLDQPAGANITVPRQDREAEADGFAVGVAQIGNVTPMGMVAALVTMSASRDANRDSGTTHPLLICRMAGAFDATTDWVRRNAPDLGQSEAAPNSLALKRKIDELGQLKAAAQMSPAQVQACSAYSQAFARGLKAAFRLVNSQTRFDSIDPAPPK